jgi:multiple sugar transport system substrate-binding protein
MKRRAYFVGSLLVAAVLAAVVAASGVAKTGTTRDASGTVTLAGWASSPVETALLKEVIRGFQHTFPKIKVNYTPISGDFQSSMLAQFAARTPPDVFYVDSSWAQDWIKQGVLEPLDKYIAQSKFNTKAFYSPLLQAFTGSDGHVYGLPKDWSPLGMETNDAMLKAAGVQPPTDWTSLKLAAEKLKGKVSGGRPICLSNTWDRALAFVYQNGGTWLSPDRKTSMINSSETTSAISFYVGLIQSGLAGTPAQLGVGWCGEALGKQKAAIVFEGNWLVPFMSDTFPSVKYTISPLVKGNKGLGNLAFTVSYSMARDSKNKDAAWQLIRYLTGGAGMRTWTSKGLALPSRSDVKPVAGREPFLQEAAASHPWQFAPAFTKPLDTANNELQLVIAGKETIGKMLQKIDSASKQALSG